MALLVGRFRDHRDDTTLAQQGSVMLRGVSLIGAQPRRPRSRPPATAAPDFEMGEQMLEHRAVTSLAGADEGHQRPPGTVDKLMDFGAQPTARAANAVVRRLDAGIVVIRPSPLCGA